MMVLRSSVAVVAAMTTLLICGSTNNRAWGFSIVPTKVLTKPTTYSSSCLRASEYIPLDDSAAVEDLVETVTAAAADVSGSINTGLDVDNLPIGLIAGAGVAIAAVFAVMQKNRADSSTSTSVTATTTEVAPAAPPAPVAATPVVVKDDIFIPYDAAARLAYCKSKSISTVVDEDDFQAFKTTYEAQAVADATAKKAARDKA